MQTMIFDRVASHVNQAIALREKVKKYETLTDAEIDIMERGMMTLNTLNRIESAEREISSKLIEMKYFNAITVKEWDANKVFSASELSRIFTNAEVLRKAFMVYANTPARPQARYHYQDVNDLEKILHDIYSLIAEVEANYRICGDYECGGN